jgi:hypothetical protein
MAVPKTAALPLGDTPSLSEASLLSVEVDIIAKIRFLGKHLFKLQYSFLKCFLIKGLQKRKLKSQLAIPMHAHQVKHYLAGLAPFFLTTESTESTEGVEPAKACQGRV